MGTRRRLLTLLVVLAVVAAPAVALRALCVGRSCDQASARTASVPFCGLPDDVRRLVTNGFYAGRSPDVLAVTRATPVQASAGARMRVPWPAVSVTAADLSVPLVFAGNGITGGTWPGTTTLDRVAPTVETLLGIERPHPEVRSGTAIPGVVAGGATSPLVVLLVMKGIGTSDVTAAQLRTAVPTSIATASGTASPDSLPLDPAAVLTTIGTGGLPRQHGVAGSLIGTGRRPVSAFSRAAPPTVIASLGDDVDHLTGDAADVGIVETTTADRGLIGDRWYGGRDDDTVLTGGDPRSGVQRMLADGFGAGGPADLLGVALGGPAKEMRAAGAAIVRLVLNRVPDATIVLTATGHLGPAPTGVRAETVAERTDATLGAGLTSDGTSGLFVDPRIAAATGVSAQQVADAMQTQRAPDGSPLFSDAFPSFAVQFGRYC